MFRGNLSGPVAFADAGIVARYRLDRASFGLADLPRLFEAFALADGSAGRGARTWVSRPHPEIHGARDDDSRRIDAAQTAP